VSLEERRSLCRLKLLPASRTRRVKDDGCLLRLWQVRWSFTPCGARCGRTWATAPRNETSNEWGETLKISVLRDEGDALLTAGNRDQRIVEQRRLVVQHLPPFICSDGGEKTAGLGESRAGWRKHASASFKGFEYSLLHIARRLSSPRACSELLHHDRAQVGKRKRSVEKGKNLGLPFLVSEAVDEDVRVERVLHALRGRSKTSSTPPLRRTAANPSVSYVTTPFKPSRRELHLSAMQDLRYALRTLRKQPVFTLVAVLTLTLGIGANTAIFSLLYQVILRPLPFPEPDRLVFVLNLYAAGGGDADSVSIPDYLDRRREAPAIEDAALFTAREGTLMLGTIPEQVGLLRVTPSFFTTLRRGPGLGRPFDDADAIPGGDRAAILTHGLWVSRFSADPGIVGRSIRVNGEAREVVGVLPPDFELPARNVSVLLPFGFTPEQQSDAERGNEFSEMIARLTCATAASPAWRSACRTASWGSPRRRCTSFRPASRSCC
jgi:hypothetical protein